MSPAINKMKNRNKISGNERKNNSKCNIKKNISKPKFKTKKRQFIIQQQKNKNTCENKSVEELNVKNKKVETDSNIKLKKLEKTTDNPKEQVIHHQKRKLQEIDHKTSAKNKKIKKSKIKSESADSPIYKPIILKNEYSANWNQLRDIIAKSDKKDQFRDKKCSREKSHMKSKKKTNRIGKEKPKKVSEEKTIEKPEIWFDDVDPILLENVSKSKEENDSDQNEKELMLDSTGIPKRLVKENSYHGETKLIAMDCEMVGVGSKFSKNDSILARVSLVNHYGQVLYDTFVKPREKVTDYRTEVSGVRREDLEKGEDFTTVQKKVFDFIKNRVLVGHALHNDMKVLFLSHPRNKIRDTSKYKAFKKLFGGRNPSLKKLTEKVVGVQIQTGEHSSIQDAQAAMRLYTLHRKEWEASLKKKRNIKKKSSTTQKHSSTQNE